MVWTTPKTWASGDILLAADMNAQVSANADFIMNTAMKKLLSVSASTAGTIASVGGAETTIKTYTITDPAFPSTSYAYVAYGTFIANPTVIGGTPSDLLFRIRDNGTGGTVAGLAMYRNMGNNDRFFMSLTAQPVTVASGNRAPFYRFISSGGTPDTFDVNYAGQTTFQGALLAPI